MTNNFEPLPWIYNSNIYEVNLRQYTPSGSFNAFANELPRLKDMGIEILYFMPVTPISFTKRKGTLGSYYACRDYTSVNPEFGKKEDFLQLIKRAHDLGFKIILDWVANHTGWDHRWTKEHPEYYKKNLEGNFFDSNGWDDVIDLDYNNPNTCNAVIEAMRYWITEFDIDGFRCDMAMLVPLAFWKQARTELDKTKKLFWLAECEEALYHQVFDATYTWKFLHTMEEYWKKTVPMNSLHKVLEDYAVLFPKNAIRTFFTSNHDENSHSGSEYERMGDAAKPFAVLCCMWPGIPFIYSGQEMPNKERIAFFERDTIKWNGLYGLHYFYKTLLNLRKTNSALTSEFNQNELYIVPTDAPENIFCFLRKNEKDEVLIVLNLSPLVFKATLKGDYLDGKYRDVFTWEEIDFPNQRTIDLSPWEYQIFEKVK